MADTTTSVGSRVQPVEDRKLISGAGAYIDDIQLPRMVHAAFLRSPHAHARIVSIDTSKAEELPGVLLVRTGRDLKPRLMALEVGGGMDDVETIEVTPLALDKVRMVGSSVAIVVATDRYIAEDALELIEVDYEPLEPVVDPQASASGEGTPLYDHMSNNIISINRDEVGDMDGALAAADRVIRETYTQQRYTHVPMECRGIIAHWNPGSQEMVIRASIQFAHAARSMLAEILGLPENKVRVIVPDVGGAFGQKGGFYPEDMAVYLTALELGVPVKWIEDRRENLSASAHARQHSIEMEMPVKNDGTILGMKVRMVDDVGCGPLYPIVPNNWVFNALQHLPSHYRVPAYSWEALCVLTNKSPEGPYRGPGAAIASWTMESTLDTVARELGLDPADVRRKNIVRSDELPYDSVGRFTLANVSSLETMEKALELIDYEGFRKEQEQARKEGRRLGIGIGSFTNGNAANVNPATFGFKGAGKETATARVQSTGSVQLFTALSPHGQGSATTMGQVLADELGIPFDTIEVLHGDSDMPADGAGTWGDRSTIMGGGAVISAGRGLKKKLIHAGSLLLEAQEEDLDVQDGYVFSKSNANVRMSVADVAEAVYSGADELIGKFEGVLASTNHYEIPEKKVAANGCHVAIVEVDPSTGTIDIKRYVGVEDVGRVINPIVVEGQIRGCVAQGLGGALFEQIVYDDSGQLITNSFMDYLLPEATDVPDIEVHLFNNPTPDTLGGFKNAGEGGIPGSLCSVTNAIADALAPQEVRINRLPLKPDRILELLGNVSRAS